jgi:hypothetical protein
MFLLYMEPVFLSTLFVDVPESLKVSIGTASQLSLAVNLMGLIMGFAMSTLALKYKHKSLLLLGMAIYGIGALGFFFAPNFATVLLANLFLGAGQRYDSNNGFLLDRRTLALRKKRLGSWPKCISCVCCIHFCCTPFSPDCRYRRLAFGYAIVHFSNLYRLPASGFSRHSKSTTSKIGEVKLFGSLQTNLAK